MKTMQGILPGPKFQPGWLKRVGVAGFLFFLIKGLLWLALPAALALTGMN